MSNCPECEILVEGEFEDVGEVVSCTECGVDLEVVSIDPVEFDLTDEDDDDDEKFDYNEEEDWDDGTDGDDDDDN